MDDAAPRKVKGMVGENGDEDELDLQLLKDTHKKKFPFDSISYNNTMFSGLQCLSSTTEVTSAKVFVQIYLI